MKTYLIRIQRIVALCTKSRFATIEKEGFIRLILYKIILFILLLSGNE
jgi:hypothetical protein